MSSIPFVVVQTF